MTPTGDAAVESNGEWMPACDEAAVVDNREWWRVVAAERI